MHEFSIAQGLVSQLQELLKFHNRHSVTSIKLSIGQFSGVVIESLLFALNALSEQEPALRGMKVEIHSSGVEYTCGRCGHSFQGDDPCQGDAMNILQCVALSCPLCGHESCTHKGGDELFLLTVEME